MVLSPEQLGPALDAQRRFWLALLGSNLFALFLGGIYEYLSLRGVIIVTSAWIVLVFVWVIGVAGIVLSEVVWGRRIRHRILIGMATALVLGLFLTGFDHVVEKIVQQPEASAHVGDQVPGVQNSSSTIPNNMFESQENESAYHRYKNDWPGRPYYEDRATFKVRNDETTFDYRIIEDLRFHTKTLTIFLPNPQPNHWADEDICLEVLDRAYFYSYPKRNSIPLIDDRLDLQPTIYIYSEEMIPQDIASSLRFRASTKGRALIFRSAGGVDY